MSGLLVVEIAQETTDHLRDRLSAVGSASPADRSRAVQEVYLACLRRPGQLRDMWEDAWKLFASGAAVPTEEHRLSLATAIRGSLELMELAAQQVEQLRGPDGSLPPRPLAEATAAVRDLLAEVEASGPWFSAADRPTVADRGAALELDDAFAEVAGVGKEAWLERVRRYKDARGAR